MSLVNDTHDPARKSWIESANAPGSDFPLQNLPFGATVAKVEVIGLVKVEILLEFIWIPESLDGHVADPYTGLRLTIRWQKHVDAYLKCARDVECSLGRFDATTLRGVATCRFASNDPIPAEWLQDGELVELLSGFRVLAVGRVVNRVPS